ncbi:15037_t:CDS:1, partial [Funneliformis mosseae]
IIHSSLKTQIANNILNEASNVDSTALSQLPILIVDIPNIDIT